jgi:hypothetical protein
VLGEGRGGETKQAGVGKIISAKLDKKFLVGIVYWNTTFYVLPFRLILAKKSS